MYHFRQPYWTFTRLDANSCILTGMLGKLLS